MTDKASIPENEHRRPTHKIVVAKSPDDKQKIAFIAYSKEEMVSVTVGLSIAAELYGLSIWQETYEAEPPH
ncbi:hypothetical protein ACQUXI_003920 [Cronobacter turicensis]|nr:hypothetical protein [Klebsiella pneumoniae]